jgi:hypothetical protein
MTAKQRKTPAWKEQFKLKAKLTDQAIERGVRLTALQVAAQLTSSSKNTRDLIRDAEMLYQWLASGKKPTNLSLVPVDSGVPGDNGC